MPRALCLKIAEAKMNRVSEGSSVDSRLDPLRSLTLVVFVLTILSVTVWFFGSSNPSTPAGYAGYLTQGSFLGKAKFTGIQVGPTSAGRTWLLSVTNISITPYTYTEHFVKDAAVLAKDNVELQ